MARRQLLVAFAALGIIAGSAAQAKAQDGFTVGYADAGPILGLGGLGGADFAIGGRYEVGFKELPDLGNGILGIQAAVDYYNVDYTFLNDDSFTYIPISVVGNYHFNMSNEKWDPFLGIGLGYLYARYDCGTFCGSASTGGVYLVGRAGMRYFMKENLAFYADVGAGAASLDVGLVWKLK
ncbi:MAG: outer membrane beta-barrel protein [Vicinamibacterales bacterium]